MNSSLLLSIITFVYGTGGALYLAAWIFKNHRAGVAATWTSAFGVLGITVGLVLRWIESYQMGYGHAPLSNLYESLLFFSWAVVVLYLVLEHIYKNRIIGAFVLPLAFMSMAYASFSPGMNQHIQPLIPALKSNWLIAHVFTCFLGYAAFTVAFGISIMYLLKQHHPEAAPGPLGRLPETGVLDELTYQMVMFGFLFLSAGIITGAVWANRAWGRYWGWDPKETWSLITWFVYATLLHARLMRGWRGKRIALLSIIGFLAVLFTYFGVNYLPGLHSYGQ